MKESCEGEEDFCFPALAAWFSWTGPGVVVAGVVGGILGGIGGYYGADFIADEIDED